ncbi:GNAT family N-acetyltransferase [Streptomyces sp. NPDC096132]|uniref:GNAT family N-acetyltransferase n=1 Tax=Streptomyces sp. NPDC096132 TaxID=3366075 RepID=UPI00380F6046
MDRDLQLRSATPEDLDWIHELRHRVYAQELGQHAPHPAGRLRDGLDGENVYLVAARGADELPLLGEDEVFEVRILTVEPRWRATAAARLLMYAALRWIAARGGRRVVAMGRTELLDMYLATGLRRVGRTVHSGAVTFEVLTGGVAELTRGTTERHRGTLERLRSRVDWRLDVPFAPRPDGCEHGGASFTAIGTDFRSCTDAMRSSPPTSWTPGGGGPGPRWPGAGAARGRRWPGRMWPGTEAARGLRWPEARGRPGDGGGRGVCGRGRRRPRG